jgi:hypothetical protein
MDLWSLAHIQGAIDSAQSRVLALPTPLILAWCLLLSLLFLFRHDAEKPVSYSVKEPEQMLPEWQGEVLQTPSIQVSIQTIVQRADI